MADKGEKLIFKLFQPKSPPPGWKCPKRFKLGLGEPWESEGSDTDAEEVVIRKEINDETKQEENDETLLDETDKLLLLASQKFDETKQEFRSALRRFLF